MACTIPARTFDARPPAGRRGGRRAGLILVLAVVCGLALPLLGVATDGGYVVQDGDTLSEIAELHGFTVDEIAWLNGIENPDLIVTGEYLRFPEIAVEDGQASEDSSVADTPDPGEDAAAVDEQAGTGGGEPDDPALLSDGDGPVAAAREWSSPDWVDSPPYVDPETVQELLVEAADLYGWDPDLILAQAWQESRWRQDGISWAGAIGVMQVLPETAGPLGEWFLGREVDPWNSVWDNIETGVAYLTVLYDATGSVETALAAYYQGLSSLERDGWFPDTEEYVSLILDFRDQFAAGELP